MKDRLVWAQTWVHTVARRAVARVFADVDVVGRAESPMRGSAVYANLHSLLDFIESAHVLEVFDGARRGVAPRQTLPAAVDDEAVIDAVCRLLVEGVAQEAGVSREALLFGVPRLTEKGRRLYEALEQL